MIKNITDKSIEIPEETEVIDVCKSMSKAIEDLLKESREQGIEQGREQGIEIGKNQTLVRLVQKGDLKIERVAAKAKMTVEQFEKNDGERVGIMQMYQIL